MPRIMTCPACKKAKPESDFTLQKNGFRQKTMPKMHGAAEKVLLQTQGGKIPHTERSKQISANARDSKPRLLAQIPMTVSDGLKKGNR